MAKRRKKRTKEEGQRLLAAAISIYDAGQARNLYEGVILAQMNELVDGGMPAGQAYVEAHALHPHISVAAQAWAAAERAANPDEEAFPFDKAQEDSGD